MRLHISYGVREVEQGRRQPTYRQLFLTYRVELTQEEAGLAEYYLLGKCYVTTQLTLADLIKGDTMAPVEGGVPAMLECAEAVKEACQSFSSVFDACRALPASYVVDYPNKYAPGHSNGPVNAMQ